jgi:hypothetical protein
MRMPVAAVMVSVVARMLRGVGRIRLTGVHIPCRCRSARGERCCGEQADTEEWKQFSKHVNPPHRVRIKDL